MQIDLPGQKHKLWHTLRADLQTLAPWFSENDRLLCPACCRAMTFDDFSVEHIIPRQALAGDPKEARDVIPTNDRSGLTLLCRRPLVIHGKKVKGTGCNGWKGRHYDSYLREILSERAVQQQVHMGHQLALFAAGYLGLFRAYGYQVALSSSGLLMRKQFFSPRNFVEEMPTRFQMILSGEACTHYEENARSYWSEPFTFKIEQGAAVAVVRNLVLQLPIDRDPNLPIARHLNYAPRRYKFRPDLTTVFTT